MRTEASNVTWAQCSWERQSIHSEIILWHKLPLYFVLLISFDYFKSLSLSVTPSARGVKLTAFRWAAGSVCERAWDTTSLQGVHSIGSWNGLLLSSCACWVSLSPLSISCYDNKASHGANCRGRQRQAGLQTHSLKVQGSLLFVTYTIIQGIIGSEMLVGTGPLNGKCKKEK